MSNVNIEFSKLPPPCYEECRKKFGVDFETGIAFTYGNTIHCKKELTRDMLVHEFKHIEQQGKIGAEDWWYMYLEDPAFRLTQEIEAYREQYKYFLAVMKDRNHRAKVLHAMAGVLSGSMYGNLISHSQARQFISENL
jgi:hypothetical protein